MREAIQAVRNAYTVATMGLPGGTGAEVTAAVTAVLLREFLDNAYTDDTGRGDDR
jgi:hypothetical protein